MKQLLILSALAVLSMVESQQITKIDACTIETKKLRVDCNYRKNSSGAIKYEWSLITEKNEILVINSTLNPEKGYPAFKHRAEVDMTDVLLRLTLTGFGKSDEGKYMCRLCSETDVKNDYNKTIPVKHADIATCGAFGLVLSSPWMLSLLLSLTVLQALDALPCGSQN
ncbi:thy-1 membrane glycoprotein-like isoform X2 [Cetorhinus maximus]